MNILIADDHDIFRQSLALLLEGRTPHRVTGHAQSFEGLATLIAQLRPDCMLLDYQMPGGEPVSAIKQAKIALPGLKIIMLTGVESSIALHQFGPDLCEGVLHKRDNAEVILQAIEQVALGNRFVSDSVAEILKEQCVELTQREWQVLTLILQGKLLHTIADNLSISTRTVEKHKENMMKKFNVTNSVQLIEAAHKLLAPAQR